jgi:hypothetical protein
MKTFVSATKHKAQTTSNNQQSTISTAYLPCGGRKPLDVVEEPANPPLSTSFKPEVAEVVESEYKGCGESVGSTKLKRLSRRTWYKFCVHDVLT